MHSPNEYSYDYGLGATLEEDGELDYIRESMVVQSRISPFKVYLLHMNVTGSVVGSSATMFTVAGYTAISPNYRATIWSSGTNHPDVRPYTNAGQGSVFVTIDGVRATRVIDVNDLLHDTEFAVVKRYDLNPARVELVFNAGFNASAHTVQYYYQTMNSGIEIERMHKGEDISESLFGWTQYLNSYCDEFQGKNQILLRLPLTTRDLVINEEGRVALEENDSWMVWSPYVYDFDLIVVPGNQVVTGVEDRYEVVNKKDSYIQGSLITQRFKLKFLEYSDPRYRIPYSTT
jgi:hypothetical protein